MANSRISIPWYENGRGNQSTWCGRALLLLATPVLIWSIVKITPIIRHAINSEDKEKQDATTKAAVAGAALSVISLMIIGCTSHSISDAFRVFGKGIRYVLCCGNTGNTGNELDELESQRTDFQRRLNAQVSELDVEQGVTRGR